NGVVGMIGLVEREKCCPVLLFVKLVVPLRAGPQRFADGDVARQLVDLGFGDHFPGPRSATGHQVARYTEDTGPHQTLPRFVALAENLDTAAGIFEDPRRRRIGWNRWMQHPPDLAGWGLNMEHRGEGVH